jgi:hypothetical protein
MDGKISIALNDNATYTGQKKGGLFYVNVPAYSIHNSSFFQPMKFPFYGDETRYLLAHVSAFSLVGEKPVFSDP